MGERSRSSVLVALAVLVGLGIGLVMVVVMPHREIVCDDLAGLDSLLGDQLGHVDGAYATWCVVPTAWSWVLVVLAAMAPLAICVAWLARRRARR